MRIFFFYLAFHSLINLTVINAQDTIGNSNFKYVQRLIEYDLYQYFDLVKDKSMDLTQSQKQLIYDECSKSPYIPFILNLCLGFGIGSWSQDHITGGVIGTVGNAAGIILLHTAKNSNDKKGDIGFYIFIGTWIIDWFVPFSYSNKYNKKLKSALGISDKTNLMILPNVNVTQNGNVAPGIMLNVDF